MLGCPLGPSAYLIETVRVGGCCGEQELSTSITTSTELEASIMKRLKAFKKANLFEIETRVQQYEGEDD